MSVSIYTTQEGQVQYPPAVNIRTETQNEKENGADVQASKRLVNPNSNEIHVDALKDGGEEFRIGSEYSSGTTVAMNSIYHSANMYSKDEILGYSNIYTGTNPGRIYTETFRFGLRDPNTQSSGREYLFFTKPDLHILDENYYAAGNVMPNVRASYNPEMLNSGLQSSPFWVNLVNTRLATTVTNLQLNRYVGDFDNFNHLLQNTVISTLDVPGLTSDAIDTPTNMYGVGYSYRGSSEGADDNPTFSLEFKDTRYLDVYYYFKAYEEYETAKHHGIIRPQKDYIINRIIHDQFSIYKFIVSDDMETILYYGKMYGVMPMSLPRDVFSNPTFEDGIKYTIDFKAAFYEDMRPEILGDFNTLTASLYNSLPYQVNVYDSNLGRADMRTAKAAAVIKDTTSPAAFAAPGGFVYKLKWRGGHMY
jgi:hypothetical protein